MAIENIGRDELKALIIEAIREVGVITPTQQSTPKRYVYGQKGLAELYHCSIATASRILKSGDISEAVSKYNRKIVIDADLALKLSGQKKGGRKWKK